jgi:hypothetical protein
MVKFDYLNDKTWEAPFEKGAIKAVYIVMPTGVADPSESVMQFVDFAQKKGGT